MASNNNDSTNEFSKFVEKVKDTADIAVTISRYMPLTLKGQKFWGNCPFHHEKTASFCVNQQQQYYYCFGCGETGNVFKFVQQYENCDFNKALEMLAKQNNLQMPEKMLNTDYQKNKKLKDEILAANKIAAKFYYNNLQTEKEETYKSYLWLRGLSDDKTIKTFGIGASLNWDGLVKELRANNISMTVAKQAGLVDEKDGRYYDFLSERLIFPIIDIYGEVVGFSGRTLKKDTKLAKYKNTPETLVFKKGQELFGMNLAKKVFKDGGLKQLILVEGQIDAISLIAAGIDGVVAPLGTAFGEGHIKILKRWCNNLVICFDGDEAGRKATDRALGLLKGSDMDVKVIYLPDGSDPDDYVKKNGKEAFLALLANASSPIEFYLEQAKNKYDLTDSTELAKFVETGIKILAEKGNDIEAEVHLRNLAQISSVNINTIRNRYMATKVDKPIVKTDFGKKDSKKLKAEDEAIVFVLASLMNNKPYAKMDENLRFDDETLNNWFNYAKDKTKKVADYINEPKNSLIEMAIGYSFKETDEDEIYYKNCLNLIKKKYIDNKIKELKNKQQTEEVIKEIAELIKQKTAFKGEK